MNIIYKLYIGDNLNILQGLDSESIDLVYLDPHLILKEYIIQQLEVRQKEAHLKILGIGLMSKKPMKNN